MSTRSHRRNGSQSSNDPTGNGANSSASIPPTVTSNTDPANDNGLDTMITVQQHTDVTTVLTQFNTMSENLNHQFTSMSQNFNQQLSTQYNVIQSLLQTIKANQAQVTTTQTQVGTVSQSITAIENQLASIQNQASTFVATTKIQDIEKEIQNLQVTKMPDPKIASLEQDVKDLQLALPSASKSTYKPKITDVSTIIMPAKPQFELASKTVKLKDLHNALNALTFSSDTIAHIKHMYARI